ncbi:(2Fe-2S)-binding protein [Propylenella binzhouense]|uniref:(2Fe-2S)-binding protein n=1 Tax=Propylenella binzhouense TaxID=2555902 RepID=A0A964T661_9HYPH|nr:(2Fe-2S)-binding protein [Propylenella binzhouense]MYZ49198.1 (2Fe-2S)-binding protein [Propylenella binzhouense]
MQPIELIVNGERLSAAVDPRTTLADFLREAADARSVHLGCEHGVCGACTIVVDGRIARSCIALAVALDGAEIWTLEGLGADPVIAQLRASFHECHGLQCGYCTPGMLVTAREILRRHPAPSEAVVREALAGNICRCTGYAGIVAAVLHAAENLAEGEIPPL